MRALAVAPPAAIPSDSAMACRLPLEHSNPINDASPSNCSSPAGAAHPAIVHPAVSVYCRGVTLVDLENFLQTEHILFSHRLVCFLAVNFPFCTPCSYPVHAVYSCWLSSFRLQ